MAVRTVTRLLVQTRFDSCNKWMLLVTQDGDGVSTSCDTLNDDRDNINLRIYN